MKPLLTACLLGALSANAQPIDCTQACQNIYFYSTPDHPFNPMQFQMRAWVAGFADDTCETDLWMYHDGECDDVWRRLYFSVQQPHCIYPFECFRQEAQCMMDSPQDYSRCF